MSIANVKNTPIPSGNQAPCGTLRKVAPRKGHQPVSFNEDLL